MSEAKAHSAYEVWLIYTFRAIEKILPALRGKSKYGWVPPFLLCVLVLGASVGVGVYLDGYVIHPPAQYTGICAPPAIIQKTNCNLVEHEIVTVSGTQTTTVITISTGIVLYNQTRP